MSKANLHDHRAARLLDIHERISKLDSLLPTPETDALLVELIDLCIEAPGESAEEFFARPDVSLVVPSMRTLWAEADYQHELYWSSRILESTDPSAALRSVYYYDNYVKLTQREGHILLAGGHPSPRRVLFIGSGPMPISLIMYAQEFGVSVDGLDRSSEAVRLGRQLCEAIELPVVPSIKHGDVRDFDSYEEYDLVVLAAAVGLRKTERREMIRDLARKLRPGAALLVRTAHGLRQIIFPQIDASDVEGLSTQLLVRPLDHVVNSIILAFKPQETGSPLVRET